MSRVIPSRLATTLPRTATIQAQRASPRTFLLSTSHLTTPPPTATTHHHPVRCQFPSPRFITTARPLRKGLIPESEDPPAPELEPSSHEKITPVAAELSDGEYHELADMYMETILARFEEMAEARDDIDVEYSAGVLTFTHPTTGTYVINKQPPNKQIWLSSPLSGPKRYDYVVVGDGQDQKEGTARGDWVYLRDGSKLADVFEEEIGVGFGLPPSGQ